MHSSSPVRLKTLSLLPLDQKNLPDMILNILNSKNKNDIDSMLSKLKSYPVKLLYALSITNPEINKLLEEDAYLNTFWADKLKAADYPFSPIQSIDKSEEISVFTQLKGAFILGELNKYSNRTLNNFYYMELLNNVCDMGIYHALIKRLNLYSDQFVNNPDPAYMDNYMKTMINDATKLNKLYWEMGCLASANILLNIADFYLSLNVFKEPVSLFLFSDTLKFSWVKKYDDNLCPYPIVLLEKAIENFYLAKLLSEFPQSRAITDQLSKGRGSFAILSQNFSSYDDLDNSIKIKLKNLNIPLADTFCAKAYNHAVDIVKELCPDNNVVTKIAYI